MNLWADCREYCAKYQEPLRKLWRVLFVLNCVLLLLLLSGTLGQSVPETGLPTLRSVSWLKIGFLAIAAALMFWWGFVATGDSGDDKPDDTDQVALGEPIANSIGMKLRLILADEFQMGSPVTEKNRGVDETQHRVKLTKPFYLTVHEVTQEQYECVVGENPREFKGAKNPVEQVSWSDAVEFCRKLSVSPAEREAGYQYRLPTEAEWEYACRAGTTTAYSFGDDETQFGEYGWFDDNSGNTTPPVDLTPSRCASGNERITRICVTLRLQLHHPDLYAFRKPRDL